MSGALKARLAGAARDEGFAAMGVCRPTRSQGPRAGSQRFLEAGRHGQMGWMERRQGWRSEPGALWPAATLGGDAGRALHARE